MLRLRLKDPNGKQHTTSFDAGTMFSTFMASAKETMGLLASDSLEILIGFPPQKYEACSDDTIATFLKSGTKAPYLMFLLTNA
jgi:hypothetical protein